MDKDSDKELSDEALNAAFFERFCKIKPMQLPGVVPPPEDRHPAMNDLIKWIRESLDRIQKPRKWREEDLTDEELRDWYLGNLSEIVSEITNTFELASFRGRELGTKVLFKVARDATEALSREVRRGNEVIAETLPECSTWPSMFSPHPKIQKVLTSDLIEKGMGTKALPSKKKVHWEYGSKRLVLGIFDYCEQVNSQTQWWKESGLHPLEHVPEIVKKIWNLPRPLSPENWQDWRKVGYEVLDHATDGKRLGHPAFEQEPLKELVAAGRKWTDRISDAWKDLARTKK